MGEFWKGQVKLEKIMQARSSQSFFNRKKLVSSTGLATGFTTVFYSTGVLSATGVTMSLPIFVGSLLGVLPAQIIHTHLSAKYNKIFRNSPNLNAFCIFMSQATTAVVGVLLGLIVTSLMVNLTLFAILSICASSNSAKSRLELEDALDSTQYA